MAAALTAAPGVAVPSLCPARLLKAAWTRTHVNDCLLTFGMQCRPDLNLKCGVLANGLIAAPAAVHNSQWSTVHAQAMLLFVAA